MISSCFHFQSILQKSFRNFIKWFSDNEMKGNSGKCHLVSSTDEPAEMQV